MSSQKRGKQYELDIVNAVYEESEHRLVPLPCGYSGNHGVPAADVVIDDSEKVHAFELKKTTKDRFIIDLDDIQDLCQFTDEYPRTCVPYVAVKFNHRTIIPVPVYKGTFNEHSWERIVDNMVKLCPVSTARRTRTGNFSIGKPDTDEWPSSKAGDDAVAILESIRYRGYVTEQEVPVDVSEVVDTKKGSLGSAVQQDAKKSRSDD